MAGNRELKITIIGDASSAQKAMGGLDQTTTKTSSTLKKVGAVAASAFGALGAASFLKGATQAAAEEGQEINVLANTLRKATGASKDQIASTEKWITKMQNATGIMDDQLRPAMGKLIISGRSVKQAESDLSVAADIAAARHKDLASVVQAMSKAAQGNVTGLGRLGVATKNAAGETLSYDEILKNASKTMGGAAAAAADTAAGRAAILHAKFEDLRENVGNALIPVMETLTGVLSKLSGWFNNQSPAVQKMVIAGAALLVALGPMVALISNVASAVKGLGIAMDFLAANPVVLIIAGVVALVAALVIAYQKSETFRNIVDAVGRALKSAGEWIVHAGEAIYDFGKKVVGFLLDYTPTGQILQHLPEILKAVRGAFQWVIDKIDTLVGWMKKLWDWIDKVLGPLEKIVGMAGKAAGVVVGGGPVAKPSHGAQNIGRGFDMGGVIPGPRGAPRMILAHAGETVLPTHKRGMSAGLVGELHQHFYGQAEPGSVARSSNQGLRDAAFLMGVA